MISPEFALTYDCGPGCLDITASHFVPFAFALGWRARACPRTGTRKYDKFSLRSSYQMLIEGQKDAQSALSFFVPGFFQSTLSMSEFITLRMPRSVDRRYTLVQEC